MKSKKLLFGITGLCILLAVIVLAASHGNSQRRYSPRTSVFYNEIKGAVQWLGKIRNNQQTNDINPIDVLNARKEIAMMINHKALGIEWAEIGPNNVGGRTRAILVDRNNTNVIYAGGVSGGLWKSTTGGSSWEFVSGMPDMNIACLAQSPTTGYLYCGTGESFTNTGYVGGTPGFIGSGLYESTDGGLTWHIFHNAKPSALNVTNVEWVFVNRIAIDPVSGRVYAATNKGLRYWEDGATAWVNPVYLSNGTTLNQANATCVVTGPDRSVVAVVGNKLYVSPNGDPHTFVDKSPSTGAGRIEADIAPSNPNYIYACIAKANGSLQGVYRSTNKGDDWTVIGPGGSQAFNLFGDNNQGGYDNVIGVFPTNADRIFVGGIVVWEWNNGGNFEQITSGSEEIDAHVDMHAICFNPQNPNIFYLGSDGGVAKTTNGGETFMTINKNYSITQFYAVACNGNMYSAMGGTQDNSNPYVAGTGLDPKKGQVLFIGDGGWAAFSLVNPKAFFGTMQYANAWRSPDMGETYQSAADEQFFSGTMLAQGTPGSDANFGRFVTPLNIWESFNNLYSSDSTLFIADTAYNVGDDLIVRSKNNNYPFHHVLTAAEGPLAIDDTLLVQDIISSHFFVALVKGLWMTKEGIQFNKTPQWFQISNVQDIHTFTVSKCGNYIFAGTDNGALYRISNILAIRDSLSGWYNSPYCVVEQSGIENFGQAITSIAIDPNNPARIVVTLGNYGNSNYVYYSSNALDADPTFVSKQGSTAGKKLPAMPVYSAVFEMGHPNMVILGTEYGIFATEDITKPASTIEWTEENSGFPKVPVFMLRQQVFNYPGVVNYGAIYAGTHGRGFFVTQDYLSVNENEDGDQSVTTSSVSVYPNPASEYINVGYSLNQKTHVTIRIYDLSGRVVKQLNLYNQANGLHVETINTSAFEKGTYIVQILAGNNTTTAKFVITR